MQEQINTSPKKIKLWHKIGIFLLFTFVFLSIYTRFLEPKWITIKETPIIDNNLPSSFDGLKIIQFSDILYGSSINQKNIATIISKINSVNPDIVLFTGDLFNDSIALTNQEYEYLRENLQNITAKQKKYAILGDNDIARKQEFLKIMQEANFTVLDNAFDLLFFEGNDPLLFVGTTYESEWSDVPINPEDENKYTIWLNHIPINLEENSQANVIFSGHTLNGLIKFPFNHYLLQQNNQNIFLENNFLEQGNTKMYISSGLGTLKYNVRFLNRPTINFYRVYKN